jgi:hypothetical protein
MSPFVPEALRINRLRPMRLIMSRIFAFGAMCAVTLAASAAFAPAMAQQNVCQQLGPLMQRQQQLIQSINAMGRTNVNPATACQRFGALAAHGQRVLAFIEANKDWCQIPDDFAANARNGQTQAQRIRGQACNAAAQRSKMERQARAQAQRQQQQQAGGNPFGGTDGFTGGAWRVPQGAL